MHKYTDNLKNHLIGIGYEEHSINEKTKELYGFTYSILEIIEGDYIIQTFLLMSDATRNSRGRFPIYKTYTQITPKGSVIYPACCIACLNDDGWHFYNASESCEPVKSCFVNYKKAKERFEDRLNIENKQTKISKLARHSCISGCGLLVFLATYFIFNQSLVLSNEVAVILIAAIVLFILPDIIGIIQNVSYRDIELTINKGME